jgi:DNA-binding CsgD family transcriptional regulator
VSAIGAQGRFEEATARFVELRLGASNPTELAGVAFAEANHHLMHLGDLGRAEALSHETLAQLPLEESELIRSMLGTVLFFSGRCADAVAIVEPLIELDVFPLDASPALASAWSVLGSPQRMLDLFDRVCSEMRAGLTRQETAWTMPVVNLTFNRLLALMQVGRLPEAEDPYGPIRDISGDPLATTDFMNRSLRATYFQLRGHLDAASAGYAGVGLELRYAPVQVIMMNHNYVATVEVLRGDVEVVRREFRGLDAIDPSSRAGLRWWEERPRMLLLAAEGDVDAAISRAMELADEFAEECLYRTWTLHDVVRMGRSELVVDSLAEMAGRDGSTWFDRACAASAAAGASRDSEALLGASATFEAGGLDLEALECAAWAARYATEPTVRARGRATASRLSERCGQVRTPAMTEVPPFLTPREFEVARLAASGLTNPEIGERLGTSARTVGNQLHHVYSKLGVSSRGELSAALG